MSVGEASRLDVDAVAQRFGVSANALVQGLRETHGTFRLESLTSSLADDDVDTASPHSGFVMTPTMNSVLSSAQHPSSALHSPALDQPHEMWSRAPGDVQHAAPSPRVASSGGIGFLLQESGLPAASRTRETDSLLGASARSSLMGFLSTEWKWQSPGSRRFMPEAAGLSPLRPSSLLSDKALLHRAAFVIPSHDEGVAVLAIPESDSMTSTRSYLRGPSEVKRVAFLATHRGPDKAPRLSVVIEFARPLYGWAVLIVGVSMMATVGPISKHIEDIDNSSDGKVDGFLLGSWNAQGLAVFFGLWALVDVLVNGFPAESKQFLGSFKGWLSIASAGTISGIGSACWTLSFEYTSVSQSYLFNSFHPALIILVRLVSLRPVFLGEVVGLLFGIGGALMSAFTSDTEHHQKVLGDLLAFSSSVSLCFYLLVSKRMRPNLPLSLMLACVCVFSALSQAVLTAIKWRGGLTFDTHPTHGLVGYLNSEYVLWWLIMLVVTSVGQAGYIGALKYLNPVVVSICMTLEPAAALLVAVLIFQQNETLGVLSLVGGGLILVGSLVTSYFSKHHDEGREVDVTPETEDFKFNDDTMP